MEVKWTHAATKHRVSRARSGHVVQTATTILREPADHPDRADRLVFLARDQAGIPLEVMAVETEEGLLIIHAMPMRPKYARFLEEDDV